MVRPVQIVEKGHAVRQAVPEILHHVVEHQKQADGRNQGDIGQGPLPLRDDIAEEELRCEDDAGLGDDQQHEGADNLDQRVVAGLFRFAEQPRAEKFQQAEDEEYSGDR